MKVGLLKSSAVITTSRVTCFHTALAKHYKTNGTPQKCGKSTKEMLVGDKP